MILDFAELSQGRAHRALISIVVPRPIAFVSTRSPEGRHNLAPFSYYMGVSSKPPAIAIAVNARAGRLKDTSRNIEATAEFVVNAATEALFGPIVESSGDYAPEIDEFAIAGLTPAACLRVAAPRVAESPVSLECRLLSHLDVGEPPSLTRLIVGEVLIAHVRDELWRDGMVDAGELRPLARLGGQFYATLGRVLERDRPRVDEAGRPLRRGVE